MKFKRRPAIGLALSGGSAKGYAHIGVIKVLQEAGIPIDMVAGTSMGSLVAGFFAAGKTVAEMEQIATSLDKKQLLKMVDLTLSGGLFAGEKVYSFFESYLKGITFKDCQIPLRIVATDMVTGEPVIYSDGELLPAIRASISLPLIFKPVEYRGALLADGGLSMPLPARLLREIGADVVIAVNVLARTHTELKIGTGTLSMADASISVMMHNLTKDDATSADVVIEPQVGSDVSHQFDQALKFINAGVESARLELRVIKSAIQAKTSLGMKFADSLGLRGN